jgi:hypothetical protein
MWIEEYIAYADRENARRQAQAAAKAIYPTWWGNGGKEEALAGWPNNALTWARKGLAAAAKAARA